jgi:uncharacterized protein (TIGR03435 family)
MVRHRVLWALIIAATAASASGQESKPAFDVVSVRPHISGGPVSDVRFDFLPSRFIARHIPLRWIIAAAYMEAERDLPLIDRVVGGPAWIDTDAFNIEGVTDGETSPAAMRLMLRTLLDERFSLRVHTEQRNGPAYAVLLSRADGRLGPRLREPVADCDGLPSTEEARQRRCGSGVYFDKEDRSVIVYSADDDVDTILKFIAQPHIIGLDRPLINRTGLNGRFSFELRFSREATASAAAPGIPLFTALQQQLGLRVEQVTAPRDVVVIDSVQQPTEN